MMSLSAVFWLLVLLFGVVGGFRGWAKEMLVLFSMVLALFLLYVLEEYVPGVRNALATQDGGSQVVLRSMLILLLAYFGYQSPNIPAFSAKLVRDKLQDWLLGSILGMLNGYFIFGSLWYFIHSAGYPWPELISPPTPEVVANMIPFLPPKVIGAPPYIFFAIGAAFVFVIVVFL
jgi:hypothetical protein